MISTEVCGFTAKDYFEMESKLIDDLKAVGLGSGEQAREKITMIVRTHILRGFFGLCDGITSDRLQLLEKGETDKYNE